MLSRRAFASTTPSQKRNGTRTAAASSSTSPGNKRNNNNIQSQRQRVGDTDEAHEHESFRFTEGSRSDGSSDHHERRRAHELRQSIEQTVRQTIRSTTTRRLMYGAVGLAVVSGLVWYFWDLLKPQVSRPVSEVATQALNVPEFQVSAEELSKAIVKQILYDPEIRVRASHFIEDLLSREATRKALTDVVIRSLNSEEFRDNATEFSKEVVNNLLQDEKVQSQFESLVGYAISTDSNKERWVALLRYTAANASFRESVDQLSEATVHQLLDSPTVAKHAQEFVEDLLQDSELQEEGGNALWGMVKNAVTPKFLQKAPMSPTAPPPLATTESTQGSARSSSLAQPLPQPTASTSASTKPATNSATTSSVTTKATQVSLSQRHSLNADCSAENRISSVANAHAVSRPNNTPASTEPPDQALARTARSEVLSSGAGKAPNVRASNALHTSATSTSAQPNDSVPSQKFLVATETVPPLVTSTGTRNLDANAIALSPAAVAAASAASDARSSLQMPRAQNATTPEQSASDLTPLEGDRDDDDDMDFYLQADDKI